MSEDTTAKVTHVRFMPTVWTFGEDARTVSGRIIPFGEVAQVYDEVDGGIVRYREEFLPGCMTRMLQGAANRGSPNWIRFTMDHDQTLEGNVGHCTALDEGADGGHAAFYLYDGTQLPKVRDMLRTSHEGFSVEFQEVVPPLVEDDVHRQRQIFITAVTATPTPAYSGARVLALRSADNLPATPNLDRAAEILASLSPTE
jgi:phage head maturation protease